MLIKNKPYLIIFLILATEELGFSLILPFLPYLAAEMGASIFTTSLLLASFSLFQFISAPVMGALSDRYGRKPLLIISQTSTLIGFLLLGLANNVWYLFLSRIIDGLFGSNATIAKAYLSDISKPKERSKAISIGSSAFALGFIIGPLLGGLLATNSYAWPAFMAASLSLISIILTIIFLKESTPITPATNFTLNSLFNFKQIYEYLIDHPVKQKLLEYSSFSFAMAIFAGTFSIAAKTRFIATPQDIGIGLATLGVTILIIRRWLLPHILTKISELEVIRASCVITLIGFILSIFANSMQTQQLIMIILGIGIGANYPLLVSSISRSVSSREQGIIMGVTSSLGSLSNIFGPLLGGTLLANSFSSSYLCFASLAMLICIKLVWHEQVSNTQFVAPISDSLS